MKKLRRLFVFVLASFMFIPNVSAITLAISDGEISYGIDEPELVCEHFDGTEIFLSINPYGKYIFLLDPDVSNNHYAVDSEGCEKLTIQEVLDFYNISNRHVSNIEKKDGENKVVITIQEINFIHAFIKAPSTFDPTETYYEYIENFNVNGQLEYVTFNSVVSPIASDIDNYYIEVYLRRPRTLEQEENTTYYEFTGIVWEPITTYDPDKILDYGILLDKSEVFTNIEKDFDPNIIDLNAIHNIVYDIVNNKLYYIGRSKENQNIEGTYTEDGTFYEEIYIESVVLDGLLYGYKESDKALFNGNFEQLTDDTFNIDMYNVIGHEYDATILDFDFDPGIFNVYKYVLLEGKNQTFNGSNDLTFKFSAPLERVSKVYVDDKEVAGNDLSLTSGSTIVTLKNNYLKSLENKTHTLKIEYVDGASNSVEFSTAYNPQTSDNIMTIFIIAILSLFGLGISVIYLKKHKMN